MSDYDPKFLPGVGANVSGQGASVIQIESNKAVPIAIVILAIAVTLSALAFGLSVGARDAALNSENRMRADLVRIENLILREQHRIDRETRLQRVEVDELKSAFLNAGYRTHLETDKP
jgi:hypothetical protein